MARRRFINCQVNIPIFARGQDSGSQNLEREAPPGCQPPHFREGLIFPCSGLCLPVQAPQGSPRPPPAAGCPSCFPQNTANSREPWEGWVIWFSM